MPRFDGERRAALEAIAAAQEGLVTAAQLRVLGLDGSSVSHRVDASGVWRRLLPGTYLTHRGEPTTSQRRRAALLYAGRDAVLTGLAALALHGSRVAARHERESPLLVLVPHHRQRSSVGFVVVERTTRLPDGLMRGALAVAGPARAAIDATRRMNRQSDVDALVADVVQSGLATVDHLGRELDVAQRRGTRLVRRALGPLRAGTRSAPEATLRRLWLDAGLREPLWNPTLQTVTGEFLARPDAYVVGSGVAVEVDSKEFHFAASDWERTMDRDRRMTAHDIVVLHVPPSRLARDGRGFMREIEATIAARAGRPAPQVRVIPAA